MDSQTAYMGGTFDPVHLGHLVTAEYIRQEIGISRIIFIPSGNPPHKAEDKVSSSEHRYNMLVLATGDNEHFDVSRIEIDRPGTTYTVDTLAILKNINSCKSKISLIVGADVVIDLLAWKEYKKVFEICKFIAVSRPGIEDRVLDEKIKLLKRKFYLEIEKVEAPLINISSTDIKKRVEKGHSIKYLVPMPVGRYIRDNGLYRDRRC